MLKIAPSHPSLNRLIERRFPGIIPASGYVQLLYSPDTEFVLEGLHYLRARKNPIAVNRAIELLNSENDYIWLNAALYLGACERKEAIPYLIKALRHTARHGDPKTTQFLRDITGLDFGADFLRWRQWWLSSHPDFRFDWNSHLGPRPRTP